MSVPLLENLFLKHLSPSEKLELLSKLSSEHGDLKRRVKELEGQRFRTSAEQEEMSQLKKQKLRMKDTISVLTMN